MIGETNVEKLFRWIYQLWFDMYETGQYLWEFMMTPISEMVDESNDFFGVLGNIDYAPYELMFGLSLTITLITCLFKFFKIDLL